MLESLARAPRETINSLVVVECTEAGINEQSSAWARESICKESQLEGLGSGLVSRLGRKGWKVGACSLSLRTKGLT